MGVCYKQAKHRLNSIPAHCYCVLLILIIKKLQQTNLKAFNPDPERIALKGGNCEKCDSYTNPIFPTLKDIEFWNYQNNRLYKIVQRLSESTNEFNSYIKNTEHKHCNGNIYCEIDTRTDLVLKVLGAK